MNKRETILKITGGIASRNTEKYFINNHNDIYNDIIQFSDDTYSFKEKIWLWVNDDKSFVPLCSCGNKTKIHGTWSNGFSRNCSVICSSNDNIRKENSKISMISKYGVDCYLKSDEFKRINKEISLEKWGVEHFSKTEEFKEKVKKTSIDRYGKHFSKTEEFKEKVKKTSMKRYGVSNYSKTLESKEKVKKTSIERYGVDNYTKSDEYKKYINNLYLNKYGVNTYLETEEFKKKSFNTMIFKYGKHFTKTEEFKEKVKKTSMKRYGVEHYTKSIESRENISKKLTKLSFDEEFRLNNFKVSKNKFYIKYLGNNNNLFRCDQGKEHNFEILTTSYHSRIVNGKLCTICYPVSNTQSFKELEIVDFIEDNYKDEIIKSYKDKFEIDIYLPKLNLGIEYNGLYWHSSKFLDKNYHLDKMNYFKKIGIRIIYIWEDDWLLKKDIIKSQIKNWIGLSKEKIYARKCEVREIKDAKIVRDFLDENHIQGKVNSSIKLGLYYKEALVSVMTFDSYEGRKKMKDSECNLSRFCTKKNTNVIGGASKILKYFINVYKPKRIISYSDIDWSLGDIYYKLGFSKVYQTKPDYKYIINKKRVNKSKFRKSNLKTTLTESQEMDSRNINKVYDCGKIKFEITF
jgi:osmotically-inducible protein OsmY